MAVLVESTYGLPQRHALSTYTTLGRSADNHIRLQDGAVSAHHAVIRRTSDGHYQLEDLGTTNGTFVGGDPVASRTLCEGDQITLGGINLCFSLRVAEGTPAPERLAAKTRSQSSALHAVKMTVSAEMSAVRPTWEMPATKDKGIVPAGPSGDMRQDYERLRAGYELIHAIVGEDDLDVILDRIVNSVIDLMSADRAALLLANAEGQLEPRVALQRHASRDDFTVSTSILSYVIEHGAAVVCNDLGQDSRFSASRSIIMANVRSAMCVPMLHDGELVGVLHLDSNIANTTFSQENLEVLAAIANTAAYAVKTAMLKEQIRHMERQRAEAMLAMISGASHFINNPLAVIRANLSMFQEWSETLVQFHKGIESDPSQYAKLRTQLGIDFIDEELAPMASETNVSAIRIEAIVRALHVFDHQQDPNAWTTFDIAELLSEVMGQEQEKISELAQCHCQLASAMVRGVRERLQLLFTNLLTNARQAIEPGSPQSNWVVASSHVLGNRVVITIDDTGRGVPPQDRTRVFAPFNTDKLDGSLGLGLAVAAEIARQHDASLHIKAREGGGTRLVLQLAQAG